MVPQIAPMERIDRTSPRVAFSLVLPVGSVNETATTAGWRRLLADSMLHSIRRPAPGGSGSTVDVSTEDLFKQADDLGARIGLTVGDDSIEFWALGSSEHQAQVLRLLLDVIQYPRLSDEDINAARARLLARDNDENIDIAVRAVNSLHDQLYKDDRGNLSAYGLPAGGATASLNGLNAEQVRGLYSQFVHMSHMVLCATGDVDETALYQSISSLPNITLGASPVAAPHFAPPGAQPPLVVRQLGTAGAWVFVGYPVPGMNSADEPALRVLTAALGEAPPSLLSRRLLARQTALATQVAVQFTRRRYTGELIAFAQTDPQNVDTVKNALLDEVSKLSDTPLSPTELEVAKNYARGSWAVEREGLHERAFEAALASSLNVSADDTWPSRIDAVTAAQVRQAARQYLQKYAVVLILPQE